MKWMEARMAMDRHFSHKPTTFFTFISKASSKGLTEVFICRGFPHYKLSDDGVVIAMRNANKNERIFIFEGPPHESNWQWYPDSLVLLRTDAMDPCVNATYEELFGIGNQAS